MRLLLAPKVRASGGGARDQAFHAPENAPISWAGICTHLHSGSYLTPIQPCQPISDEK